MEINALIQRKVKLHKRIFKHALLMQISQPCSLDPIYLHILSFVMSATHYTVLTVPPSVLQSTLPSLFHCLFPSQPCGLPAITPPVHQHRGQEGGIYADIWIVIPTTHAVCQCTAGSSLQHAHTSVPKLRTLHPYGQEIRLTSQ